MSDSDRETQAEINQLEQEIDDLRREYEQFFNDNRDYPPTNKRKQVEQQLRELKRSRLPETRMDFKVRSLDQRFTTLKSKWDRIEQKIERGTYQPHVERANDRVGDGRDDQDRSDNQENDRDVTGQPRDGKWDVDTDAARGDLEKMAQRLEEMNQEGQLDKYAGDGNDSADETAVRPTEGVLRDE
ncbi:MAG: hypothetical protein ABEL76_12600, partial [Bradymonadaceae bacterium]